MTSNLNTRIGLGFGLVVVVLQGCGTSGSSGGSTIDPTAVASSTYTSISKVVLTPGCVSCHGGSGGYSFDTYAHTMSAVTAGNANSSALYTSISHGSMPKSGTAPSAAQIQAVQAWIAAGAQNN